MLNSRVTWFTLAGISIPFGERAKRFRYRLYTQYVSQLPVPSPSETERAIVASLGKQAGEWAKERFELAERVSRGLEDSFKTSPMTRLSEKVRNWPSLSFKELGHELKRAFVLSRNPWDNPANADEWANYLRPQHEKHADLTYRIAAAEEEINQRVYQLFHLTREEIRRLEQEAPS